MPGGPVLSHREITLTYTQRKTEKNINLEKDSYKYSL
jgi:hypothetical protein